MRRLLIPACIGLTLCIHPEAVSAQGAATVAARIEILKKAAEALGAAGDAIGKLTDGIAKMVGAGDRAISTIQARRAHDRLVDLSAEISGLSAAQTVQALPALEGYLAAPDSMSWLSTRATLRATLARAERVLRQLTEDNRELALDSSYAKLELTLMSRMALLEQLTSITTPPTTRAELAELRKVLGRYRVLVAQLQNARDEMNAYIRSLEP